MATAPQAPMFVREMGLSARFALYVLASLIIMTVDARFDALSLLRSGLATVLRPVETALARPFQHIGDAFGFFTVHATLLRENAALQQEHHRMRAAIQDRAMLQAENARLRQLLELPLPPGYAKQAVEIIQSLGNPFSRKVLINKGARQGIVAGRPVVDARGMVGQVTRVFPASSEVTLITAQSQVVPVQSMRSGLRLIVSGFGEDRLLEVRYLDRHADLKTGDVLVTSGLDGEYPPGIPVARVIRVDLPRHEPFARAYCVPLGGVSEHRQMLVLARTDAAVPAQRSEAGR